jgi:hypothetical protein
VDEPRRVRTILRVLAVPLIIAVAVPLAAIAAIGFCLLAMAHGIWLVCWTLPRWLWSREDRPAPRKPHFLATRPPATLED